MVLSVYLAIFRTSCVYSYPSLECALRDLFRANHLIWMPHL